MKIWCQSCAAIGNDPKMQAYEKALVERSREIARPDTTVHFYGVDAPIPGSGQAYAASHLCTTQAIRNAIRAENQGYDVFASTCTMDNGSREIKQLTEIPAVFSMEVAIHTALTMAPSYAFLAQNESLLLRLGDLSRHYGLDDRMVPGACLNLNLGDFQEVLTNPKKYVDQVLAKAREASSKGACILLPSGTPLNMFLVSQGIRKVDDVPILDVLGCVIKTAELVSDFKKIGIDRSRSGLFGRLQAQTAASLRAMFEADSPR